MQKIREKLILWRDRQAREEGVENFRVLSNATLHALAEACPTDKEGFMAVHGFKEGKWRRYGFDLLRLLTDQNSQTVLEEEKVSGENVFTVGEYLDAVNAVIRPVEASVRGEVAHIKQKDSYVFFSLKENNGSKSSILDCFAWQSDIRMSGIVLEEGAEVCATGFPEIYKASGKFSFRARSITLVGEGALKKAYERLKAKLSDEGLFDASRKKPLPDYPRTIGLITSREGAVIHDFLSNIDQRGFHIMFHHVRVEGVNATRDILAALAVMRKRRVDLTIVIRGGGSVESLQVFNNETLVREIASMPMPVVCGIGHHEDVPLVTLACDLAVSTPTAAAVAVSRGWQEARYVLEEVTRNVFESYKKMLSGCGGSLDTLHRQVAWFFDGLQRYFEQLSGDIFSFYKVYFREVNRHTSVMQEINRVLSGRFSHLVMVTKRELNDKKRVFSIHNPQTLLRKGYAIVSGARGIISSSSACKEGENIRILFSDGNLRAQVLAEKKGKIM